MSSTNKYKIEKTAGYTVTGGERKQRDHTKKGILAARRERRRQEAISRQTTRIEVVRAAAKGDKVPKDITDYISTFLTPHAALRHAMNTLMKIKGGFPTAASVSDVDSAPVTPVAVVEEKPKSKYKKKKAAVLKNLAEGGTVPAAV